MPCDRVLNGKELVCVDKARGDLYGDIVRTLLLTGQRLGQITHLRAEYVDTDAKTISWPASAMKGTGRTQFLTALWPPKPLSHAREPVSSLPPRGAGEAVSQFFKCQTAAGRIT